MPPGRRRGGKSAKEKGQLEIGDLVLAKVKGFPAWPAKISNPEDWKKSPDPRKHFVYFFGTSEIAYVAPVDIQVFTSDSKSKLYARCQGKKVKGFAHAVDEICEAFDDLQQKGSDEAGYGDDRTSNDFSSTQADHLEDKKEIPSLEDEMVEHKGKISCSSPEQKNESLGLQHSENQDGNVSVDKKEVVSQRTKSHIFSRRTKNKRFDNGSKFSDEVTNQDAKITSSLVKVELPTNSNTETGDVFLEEVEPDSLNVHLLKGNHDNYEDNKLQNGLNENGYEGCWPVVLALEGKVETLKSRGRKAKKMLYKASSENHLRHSKSQEEIGDRSDDKSSRSVDDDRVSSSSDAKSTERNEKHTKSVSKSPSRNDHKGKSVDKSRFDVPEKDSKIQLSSKDNRRNTSRTGKRMLASSEESLPTKRSKTNANTDSADRPCRGKASSSLKGEEKNAISAVKSQNVKKMASTKGDGKLSSSIEVENKSSPERRSEKVSTNSVLDESTLPSSSGQHDHGSKTISKFSRSCEAVPTKVKSTSGKHSFIPSHPRRRTFRLYEEDGDEPRTPVHGKSPTVSAKAIISVVSNSNAIDTSTEKIDSRKHEVKPCKDGVSLVKDSPAVIKLEENITTKSSGIQVSSVSLRTEYVKSFSRDGKPDKLLKISNGSNTDVKPADHKTVKPQGKIVGSSSVKKSQAGSSKLQSGASSNGASDTISMQRVNPSISKEKQKSTPKNDVCSIKSPEYRAETNCSAECNLEKDNFVLERLGTANDRSAASSIEAKYPESATSMKHLIAAAQAKRKQAQSHFTSYDTVIPSFMSIPVTQARSPIPVSAASSFPHENTIQKEKGFYSSTFLGFPHAYATMDQVEQHEEYEHSSSPTSQQPAGSLSGGTEAAVVRDAFEGTIETLSRTKDSIARATRLAIDCAKHGIASEVVELLIRKLENEPSFHRRVDLFFLVDSITQISHNQKGIASTSFVPTVQEALPRLLGAAAPPGSGARENRRQCIKVLKIWCARKIMPESVLRRCMDDIEVPNDGTASGPFHRRPLRAERSIDDPVREMEGILVDEYGSNTFQLPVLLSSNIFEDEDGLLISLSKDAAHESSPSETGSDHGEPDACAVTSNEKRHRVLKVVGELEMEDVSRLESQRNLQSQLNSQTERYSPSIGSPPLPLDSPPSPPPLPPSPPPPPTPPPPSLSPPPSPTPPPPLSPPPPPPPPDIPPPPPEPSSSLPIMYHNSLQDYSSMQSRHLLVQMNVSTTIHANRSLVDPVVQQSPNVVAAAMSTGQPLLSGFTHGRPFEYGHNEMYLTPQGSHPNQQFQPTAAAFQQRTYNLISSVQTSGNLPVSTAQTPLNHHMLPQTPPNHFPYANHALPQHISQTCSPYNFPSHQDGRRHPSIDEQWRTASSSGTPFVQDGFLRPSMERQCSNSLGFQPVLHSSVVSGAPVPGHGGMPTLPCRPDAPGLNCWRPS